MPTASLRPELLEALQQLDYTELTPIQEQTLGPILAGSDVLAQAKTGSGKTAAFGLGLLQQLADGELQVQVLVLCPTRELAEQVTRELRLLAQRIPNVRIATICGGRAFRDQRLALNQGAQIVVGTPGRVADHLRKRTIDLTSLRILVLDEADRMLDMGFTEEVSGIISECPTQRQTLLFSATYPESILGLSREIQIDPLRVEASSQVSPQLLQQTAFDVDRQDRHSLVAALLAHHRPAAALVFCETRSDCEMMSSYLENRGAHALCLHGGLEQQARDDVMVQFVNGSTRVLVATNVAARGLDIPDLPLVIIAELSGEPEAHLHRIGRTGRAGRAGHAASIVCGEREQERRRQIESLLGYEIPAAMPPEPVEDLSFLKPENATVLILAGRKQKLRKGDVLGALVKDGGLPAAAVGHMELRAKTCAVAISIEYVEQAMRYLVKARVKNQRIRAVLL